MKLMKLGLLAAIIVGGTQIASAGEPWGTDEAAGVCDRDYAAHQAWLQDDLAAVDQGIKHGEVSAACKAELEKRATLCVADPAMQAIIKDPDYAITNPPAWCEYRAFVALGTQLDDLAEKAAEAWGTADTAAVCEQDYSANQAWHVKPPAMGEAMKNGEVSAGCKAQIEQRVKLCLKDPKMQMRIKDPVYGLAHTDPTAWCAYRAFVAIGPQVAQRAKLAEQAAEAKAAKDAVAKLDAVEVPKPGMRSASLEKAIAVAYRNDYDGKVLKVVLDHWDTDLDKDAFGRVTGRDLGATVINKQPDGKCQLHYELWLQQGNGRSFYGPFSALGGGSVVETEILCSKVERAKR